MELCKLNDMIQLLNMKAIRVKLDHLDGILTILTIFKSNNHHRPHILLRM